MFNHVCGLIDFTDLLFHMVQLINRNNTKSHHAKR